MISPEDVRIFVQFKKPFRITQRYSFDDPLLAAFFRWMNGAFAWSGSFQKDILPSLSNEFSFLILDNESQTPVLLFQSREGDKLKQRFPNAFFFEIRPGYFALADEPIPFEEYFSIQKENSISDVFLEASNRYSFIKVFISKKELPASLELPESFIDRVLQDMIVFLDKEEGYWKFQIFSSQSSSEKHIRPLIIDPKSEDVAVFHGYSGEFLSSSPQFLEFFPNERAKQYFFEEVAPFVYEYFDLAFSKPPIEDQNVFLVALHFKDQNQEDAFFYKLKMLLAYMFPSEIQRELIDGTEITELVADPNTINLVLLSKGEQIFAFEKDKKRLLYYQSSSGKIKISRTLEDLYRFEWASGRNFSADFCPFIGERKYIFFGSGFMKALLPTPFDTFFEDPVFKKYFFTAAPYRQTIAGCILQGE